MARLRKTEVSSCACRDTGWIELPDSCVECPEHFKGQVHPGTYNLLADEPARLIEEERRSRLQFQINQYKTRINKLQLQIQISQEKLLKLESELIKRTPTVRMAAVRFDADPMIEIVDIADITEEDLLDLSWEESNE